MIRAAAKNHGDVAVVVDVADYADRARRARSARRRDHASRCAASSPPRPMRAPRSTTRRSPTGSRSSSATTAPAYRAFGGQLAEALRYGENPHQAAAFYRAPETRPGVATARQVQGKQLSYNNINDTDAAYECVGEFDPAAPPPSSSSSTPIRAASPRARACSMPTARRCAAIRSRPSAASSRSTAARRRGGARHRRDLHRGDHRARRQRGGDRHRRRQEEPAPAAGRRPARSARRTG